MDGQIENLLQYAVPLKGALIDFCVNDTTDQKCPDQDQDSQYAVEPLGVALATSLLRISDIVSRLQQRGQLGYAAAFAEQSLIGSVLADEICKESQAVGHEWGAAILHAVMVY